MPEGWTPQTISNRHAACSSLPDCLERRLILPAYTHQDTHYIFVVAPVIPCFYLMNYVVLHLSRVTRMYMSERQCVENTERVQIEGRQVQGASAQ